MPIREFSHVNLRLDQSQIEVVRDFYVQVLGLQVGHRPRLRSSGYWLYAGDAPIVHVVQAEHTAGSGDRATGAIDHLAFDCVDVNDMKARLMAAGVDFDARRVDATDQYQLLFLDPAGTRIELLFAD